MPARTDGQCSKEQSQRNDCHYEFAHNPALKITRARAEIQTQSASLAMASKLIQIAAMKTDSVSPAPEFSRRDFLGRTAVGAAALALSPCAAPSALAAD